MTGRLRTNLALPVEAKWGAIVDGHQATHSPVEHSRLIHDYYIATVSHTERWRGSRSYGGDITRRLLPNAEFAGKSGTLFGRRRSWGRPLASSPVRADAPLGITPIDFRANGVPERFSVAEMAA